MKCAGWMNSIVISTVISGSNITANCHCQAIYYLPRQLNDPEIFQLFSYSVEALCVKGKTNSTLTWGNMPFTIALNSSIDLKAIGKKNKNKKWGDIPSLFPNNIPNRNFVKNAFSFSMKSAIFNPWFEPVPHSRNSTW